MKSAALESTDLDPAEGGTAPARRASEQITRAVLRVITGPHAMRYAVVRNRGRVVVGRDPECGLVLEYGSISRQHFEVRHLHGDSLMVEDLESTNGTRLNGELLARPTPVVPGDEISVGNHLLRVERLNLDEIAQLSDLAARLGDQQVDPATGLLARRYLDEIVLKQLPGLAAARIPYSLLLVDVDRFKQINSRYGAQVGDAALRVLGRLVRESIRDQDRAIRAADDAIAVVVPNCQEDAALKLAERLIVQVADHDWARILRPPGPPIFGEEPERLQISIGVAQHVPGETLGGWIHRGTRAVLVARQLGGGQAVSGSQVA